jgi:hypothetical protein
MESPTERRIRVFTMSAGLQVEIGEFEIGAVPSGTENDTPANAQSCLKKSQSKPPEPEKSGSISKNSSTAPPDLPDRNPVGDHGGEPGVWPHCLAEPGMEIGRDLGGALYSTEAKPKKKIQDEQPRSKKTSAPDSEKSGPCLEILTKTIEGVQHVLVTLTQEIKKMVREKSMGSESSCPTGARPCRQATGSRKPAAVPRGWSLETAKR